MHVLNFCILKFGVLRLLNVCSNNLNCLNAGVLPNFLMILKYQIRVALKNQKNLIDLYKSSKNDINSLCCFILIKPITTQLHKIAVGRKIRIRIVTPINE